MVFRYQAKTAEGQIVSGLVEAPDEGGATRILHNKQLLIISLAREGKSFNLSALTNRFKKVSGSEVVNFTRQLATMIVAGLSLPESLTILRQQTTNQVFAAVLADIEHQIVGGSNLADALASYPAYFSRIYVTLIKAGESSGTLDKILSRLAETLEGQREFKSKVVGAMIYPIIIVVGMIVVVMVMMIVVIPKLTDLYRDFNIDLPATTQLLMGISGFFVQFWWLIILLAVGGGILIQRWRKTLVGQLALDGLILKIPLLGNLQKKVILVDFTRTLAMLIASGIHILEALRILEASLGNIHFRNAIAEISKKVEKGFPLGDTFAQYPVFPLIVPQMMKVGEETGKLDDTLTKLSSYFQSESDHLVKGLTTAIEPIIMVFLGVGVGFIVISVITPIYSLTSQFK